MNARRKGPRTGAFLLYNGLLALAGLLVLPWVAIRALGSPAFRQSLPGRLGHGQKHAADQWRLLVHGVSVGEVKAARPLVRAIRERHPQCEIVVCSTTAGGREMARKIFPRLAVEPYPLDLTGACRRFLQRVRPTAVVLMELEIWPNFLRACDRAGIPVAIVNGRITERSMSGYLRVQRFLPQFDRIRLYGVQNERYADRFRQLDVPAERIVNTGNLKYDNLPQSDADEEFRASVWPTWVDERVAFALGSTHPGEEEELLLAASRRQELDDVLWLVVPRHPDRAEALVARLRATQLGARPILLRSQQPAQEPLPARAILVVDTFGELESVYRVARGAFVGGSLVPHGGQNVLEPAALGRPIFVGPHTENFAEEVALLERTGGLRRVNDAASLIEFCVEWLQHPHLAEARGQAALEALASQRGGAQATLAALARSGLLNPPSATAS